MNKKRAIMRAGYAVLTALLALVFYISYDTREENPGESLSLFSGRSVSVVSILCLGVGIVGRAGSGLDRPVIFDLQRTGAGLGFRFLTEASTSYAVEVTGNLTNRNWLTLTNIVSARDPVAVINDAAPGFERGFYRIRTTKN
jgi:hypothetical protein